VILIKNIKIKIKSIFLLIGMVCLLLIFTRYQVIKMSNENKKDSLNRDASKILQDINYKAFSKVQNTSTTLANNKSIINICLQNDNFSYSNAKIVLNAIQGTSNLELCAVMNKGGIVLASSDYNIDISLKVEGQNFSFRPYFFDALQGKNVIYPALGKIITTRGIFFSSPIKDVNKNIIGVIVCKINVDEIDTILKEYKYKSLISTSDGIVFSSNRKEWLFSSVYPLSAEKLEDIVKSKQFPDILIKPLNLDLKKFDVSEKTIGDTKWKLLTMATKDTAFSLTPIQFSFITIITIILIALIVTIAILIHTIFKRNESQLNFKKLFHAVEQSSTTVVITDTNGIMEYVNPMFVKLTGYSVNEAIGKNTSILKSGEHNDMFFEKMWTDILSGEDWRGSFCNKKKNGEIYWEDTIISSVKNSKGEIINFIAVKEDVTKRRELDELLNKYATMDEMTGTFNRRSCMLLLEKELQSSSRQNRQFVIFFMDINGLKSVNDSLGHGFGDSLIISAVDAIRASLRESDSICRLGGDEFLVILPDTNILGSEIFLARIEEKTCKINTEEKYPFILSLSFGVAEYSPASKSTIDDLLQIADERMYKNKAEIKQKQGTKGIFR